MAVQDINIIEPFYGGDLNIFNSDYQNIQAIILAQKGQLYQFPLLGACIIEHINRPEEEQFLRTEISQELNKDNYELTDYETNYVDSKLTISLDAVKTDV